MAVQGPIPVRSEDVFPHGAFAVSVEPMRDFERSQGGAFVQARDKVSGGAVVGGRGVRPDPRLGTSRCG